MRTIGMSIIAASAVALAIMMVLSILSGDSYSYSTQLFSILLLAIPAWCLKHNVMVLPWPILLGIGLSLFLHSLGLVTGWYHTTNWWDSITHFVSGITVASLAAIVLIMVIVHSETTRVPVSWTPFLILVSVLAMEGVWEILEFAMDSIVGTGMQHGLEDTMKDIVANTVSGIVAGLGFAYYVSKGSLRELVDGLRVEGLVEWSRRTFPD
ncbi:hypothetical protein AOA80_03515 [Methanomassiliicoccales archaeon RumEn M1]|jgi:uncharacterized membrane protein YjdF|nr:hypothetical protein AOA80_03515 [Methanomassiliicoccales archaeon RumEn M1]